LAAVYQYIEAILVWRRGG